MNEFLAVARDVFVLLLLGVTAWQAIQIDRWGSYSAETRTQLLGLLDDIEQASDIGALRRSVRRGWPELYGPEQRAQLECVEQERAS